MNDVYTGYTAYPTESEEIAEYTLELRHILEHPPTSGHQQQPGNTDDTIYNIINVLILILDVIL